MGGSDGASWTRSWRLRGLMAVIAVMVLLVAGWPLVNAVVSGSMPVPAGQITETEPAPGRPSRSRWARAGRCRQRRTRAS